MPAAPLAERITERFSAGCVARSLNHTPAQIQRDLAARRANGDVRRVVLADSAFWLPSAVYRRATGPDRRLNTERRLLADWKDEIARGVDGGQLVRFGRTVTLHSGQVGDDDALGAQEMINARAERARKLATENPSISVAALAERTGVSTHTISRARRAAAA
jgi:hypothetical protein